MPTKPTPAKKTPAKAQAKTTPAKKPAAKRKNTTTKSATKSASLAQQPVPAPGAIPVGGTDTQVQANQAGVVTQEHALAVGKHYLPAGEGNGLSEAEAYAINKEDVSALQKIASKFDGVPMTDVNIPSSSALAEAHPGVVFEGNPPAFTAAAQMPDQPAPKTPVQDTFGTAAEQQAAAPEPGRRISAISMRYAVTRLKMTLHSVTPLDNAALTRCTFGAVYSATPGDEDKIYGDATPYGSLSYNVRSEIAEGLEVGQAYYIDIQKVPS